MKKNRLLFVVFALALLLRLVLISIAYHGDLNNNWSWGKVASEKGLEGFYGDTSDSAYWEYSAPNQPPLYILYFAGVYKLHNFVNSLVYAVNESVALFPSGLVWWWEDNGKIMALKLGSVVADLGIGMMIYHYIITKTRKAKSALIFTTVWLFNPISYYNSAIWGQTDSIVNLLGLAALISLFNKRITVFALSYTASLLFKPSLVIFAPVLLVIIYKKYKISELLQSAIYSIIFVIVSSILFYPYYNLPIWLAELYMKRILPGEIGYLTANAFNFWWLVNPGKVLDSMIYFGFSARLWGYTIGGGLISYIVYALNKSKKTDKKILLALMLSVLTSFLFFTRIHERYLYPLFPLATIILSIIPSFRIIYVIFSTTFLLNMYHLFWAPDSFNLKWMFYTGNLQIILTIMNIFCFAYLVRFLARRQV